MSASTSLIAEYLRTRYSSPVFLALATLLALAGTVGATTVGTAVTDVMLGVPIAYLSVLAFRVWDDLEDRPRDRVEHPQRITVRGPSVLPFVHLGVVAAVAAVALICVRPGVSRSLAALGAAAAVLLVWYRVARRSDTNRLLSTHIVLLKYPAIAYATAPASHAAASSSAMLVGLVMVYLAICVYEGRDDPHLRASRSARAVLVVEAAVLFPLAIYAVYAALSAPLLTALAGA